MWVAGILSDLVAYVRHLGQRAGGSLVTVIDSTNGLLDGSLMAAGLAVYRADPPSLPGRPLFGSVDARTPGTRTGDALSLPPVLGARPGSVVPHVDALPANVLR
ncbi:MAG TPA: hypothetical protein VGP31_10100 [Planosporangium sp.]|jgi:hypothetical protein|nr:hypothetical protein [Planosporangium sp.]